MLPVVLDKDLVKLENMERPSEGVQSGGTSSRQDCKLCDSLREWCHSGRALEGRNQHCIGLGADEMASQVFQTEKRGSVCKI